MRRALAISAFAALVLVALAGDATALLAAAPALLLFAALGLGRYVGESAIERLRRGRTRRAPRRRRPAARRLLDVPPVLRHRLLVARRALRGPPALHA